jgi:hypothetical protein
MKLLFSIAIGMVFFLKAPATSADSVPVVSMVEPIPGALFHNPIVHLHANASDDAGPVKLRVYQIVVDSSNVEGPQTLIGIGTDEVDATTDVSSYPGQLIEFLFVATDSAFQETRIFTHGVVNTSAALTEVLSLPGEISNWGLNPPETISSNAVLYVRTDSQTSASDGKHWLVRRNRQNGSDQNIAEINYGVSAGYVTRAGALYLMGQLFEFDGVTNTVIANQADYLSVSGSFAIWNEGPQLVLRDLDARTNVIVSTQVSGPAFVLSTGDVIYGDHADYQIHRYSHGIKTTLTSDSLFHFPVAADATNVLDMRRERLDETSPPSLVLITPLGEVVLKEESFANPAIQLKDGFVAFEKQTTNGIYVWERMPDGTQTRITTSPAHLVELGPGGQVLFMDGGVLYYSRPGSEPLPLIGDVQVGFVDGELSVAAGGALFRINPYSIPIKISLPSFLNGGWQLGVSGQVAASYVVQRSPDLLSWSDFVEGVFQSQSPKTLPISIESPHEFFRATYR